MEAIGDNFCLNCSNIVAMDMSMFAKVSRIGKGFLCGSTGLKSLDLSPMSALASVDGYFLCRTGIVALDAQSLLPVSRIPSVGENFLARCTALLSVDLACMATHTHLPDGFLSGCSNLISLDLGPLKHVVRIGSGFLMGCDRLAVIDVSPLASVEEIAGDSFLGGCSGLTAVFVDLNIRLISLLRECCPSLRAAEDEDKLIIGASAQRRFLKQQKQLNVVCADVDRLRKEVADLQKSLFLTEDIKRQLEAQKRGRDAHVSEQRELEEKLAVALRLKNEWEGKYAALAGRDSQVRIMDLERQLRDASAKLLQLRPK